MKKVKIVVILIVCFIGIYYCSVENAKQKELDNISYEKYKREFMQKESTRLEALDWASKEGQLKQ